MDGYIWPSTLRVPARPPKLVYLDLLHWVSLSKAYNDHKEAALYAESLTAFLDAADRGLAVFPISDAIYMEVSKIGQRKKRRDLRNVIERLSGFRVVTSRVVVAEHEVEALLDRRVGSSPDPVNTMDYLDWGVMRAFGMDGKLRVKSSETGADVTEEARQRFADGPAAFDAAIAKAELDLNRAVLDGPTPEEEPEMRSSGWNPRAAFEAATRRADQERDQVGIFDANPSWRDQRLRQVVAAREVAIEINAMLWRDLNARGVPLEAIADSPDEFRAAFDSMPSFDVSVSLKTAFHRNPSHPWSPNHILDIDALSSTVPYCDIVVTDKEAAAHLKSSGVARRLGTTVLARLSDLPALLATR